MRKWYGLATNNGGCDYTVERFKTICKQKKPSVSEEFLDKFWPYFDTDSNGVLSWEEYKKGMLREVRKKKKLFSPLFYRVIGGCGDEATQCLSTKNCG